MVTDSGMRWVHAVRRCWGLGYGSLQRYRLHKLEFGARRETDPVGEDRGMYITSRLAQRSGRVYSVSLRVDVVLAARLLPYAYHAVHGTYVITLHSIPKGHAERNVFPDPPAAARRPMCHETGPDAGGGP